MAVVTVPGYDAPRDLRQALAALLLLVFLGLISLAVATTVTVDCRDELLTADDGVTILTGGKALLTTGRRQCRVDFGEVSVPVPAWTQAIGRVLQ
jgi:hypothetical protein